METLNIKINGFLIYWIKVPLKSIWRLASMLLCHCWLFSSVQLWSMVQTTET